MKVLRYSPVSSLKFCRVFVAVALGDLLNLRIPLLEWCHLALE